MKPQLKRTPKLTRRDCLPFLLAPFTAVARAAGPSAPASTAPVRLAISDQVVYGINRNDAAAAIGVWSTELARSLGLKLAPRESWLLPSEQLLDAIRDGLLDLFCITVIEYRRVRAYVDKSRLLCDGGDELVLVVREAGGISSLEGLRGRSIVILDGPFTVLADSWLSVMMAREGLGSPAKVFARVTRNTRVAQVVLPVFFGQVDACVVSRRGLETMFELNPQLSKKLKILQTSPKMISAFLSSHKDYPMHDRNPLLEKISRANTVPAAKQVLTLFQSKGFSIFDGEMLRPSMDLLDAYERSPDGRAAGKR